MVYGMMQLKITQKTHSWRLLYGVIQTTKALWEVATESENESKRRLKQKNEHETKVCRSCQRDGCWCGQLSECLDCHGRGKIPCKECRK